MTPLYHRNTLCQGCTSSHLIGPQSHSLLGTTQLLHLSETQIAAMSTKERNIHPSNVRPDVYTKKFSVLVTPDVKSQWKKIKTKTNQWIYKKNKTGLSKIQFWICQRIIKRKSINSIMKTMKIQTLNEIIKSNQDMQREFVKQRESLMKGHMKLKLAMKPQKVNMKLWGKVHQHIKMQRSGNLRSLRQGRRNGFLSQRKCWI